MKLTTVLALVLLLASCSKEVIEIPERDDTIAHTDYRIYVFDANTKSLVVDTVFYLSATDSLLEVEYHFKKAIAYQVFEVTNNSYVTSYSANENKPECYSDTLSKRYVHRTGMKQRSDLDDKLQELLKYSK